MKILLAIDGSPFSRKMLVYVASNEKWFRPDYTYVLLHVVAHATSKNAPPDVVARPVLDEAASYLQGQIGFNAIKVTRVGKAAVVIPEFARREECNMIVMGSHGYGSLESLVLGSVTQGVLTVSHVPVLVVR